MAYKTYPYFAAGIGADTHIRYSYEIDERELRVLDRLGSTIFVPLPPTSVEIRQNVAQKIIDVGDVIVHKQGRTPVVCESIKHPFTFKTALYGDHPDIKQKSPDPKILHSATPSSEFAVSSNNQPKSVPPSIFFDFNLLLIPTFEEVGIPQALGQLGELKLKVQIGHWVDRGDLLLTASYPVYRSDQKPKGWFSREDKMWR